MNDSVIEFNNKAKYKLNFVPYRDDNDMVKWAVYDAKRVVEEDGNVIDGAAMLSGHVAIEVASTKKPISQKKLEQFAEDSQAKMLFSSDDENALGELQDLLDKIPEIVDAEAYLDGFGFRGDHVRGYPFDATKADVKKVFGGQIKEGQPSAEAGVDVEEDHIISEEAEADIAADEPEILASIPLHHDEEWSNTDAYRLLWSALTYKQQLIDDSFTGTYKSVISAIWGAWNTVVETPTAFSVITMASAIAEVGLLGYAAAPDIRDRDEILRDFAQYIKDLDNPELTRDEAIDNLKKNMKNSAFSYEAIHEVDREAYKKDEHYFRKISEYKGFFDDKAEAPKDILTSSRVDVVGERVRNFSKHSVRFLNLTKLRGERNLSHARTAFKEVGSDLWGVVNFMNDGKKRKEIFSKISNADKSLSFNFKKHKERKAQEDAEKQQRVEVTRQIDQFTKNPNMPDVLDAEIDAEEYIDHIKDLDAIKSTRKFKKLADTNFVNVTLGMTAQLVGAVVEGAGAASSFASGNVAEGWQKTKSSLSNAYGIATGIGAYAQSADNVTNLGEKLDSKRAQTSERYEYLQEIEPDRLKANLIEQNQERAKEQHVSHDDAPGAH